MLAFIPLKFSESLFLQFGKKVSNYVRSSIISQWTVSPKLDTLVRVNWQKLIVN